MKQLQLTPPLILITMGYPGAGKTYFSRQFAEEYHLPRVSEDRIRFELFNQPDFSTDEQEIIDRIVLCQVEELTKTNQTFIIDGSFVSLDKRLGLAQLATQVGYRLLVVWLQTDQQTCQQRAARRDKRTADNKYSFATSPVIFETLKKRLQRPIEKEGVVVVSGKHNYKSQSLTVLRKVALSYSEAMSRGDFKLAARNEQQQRLSSARTAPTRTRRMIQ